MRRINYRVADHKFAVYGEELCHTISKIEGVRPFEIEDTQEDFKVVLEKLVLAFVIAEKEAELSSDKDGYVLPSTIRHRINDILSKMSKE